MKRGMLVYIALKARKITTKCNADLSSHGIMLN